MPNVQFGLQNEHDFVPAKQGVRVELPADRFSHEESVVVVVVVIVVAVVVVVVVLVRGTMCDVSLKGGWRAGK